MTGALAIASVTAMLKELLENGLAAHPDIASVGEVNVSVLPPDRIATGGEEHNQLNLFMYRVSPHSGLSKMAPTQQAFPTPTDQPTHQQLALNLSYLLTAYGAQDFQAEVLLGCAIQLLHEIPVLSRDMIREASKSAQAKKGSGLILPAHTVLSASNLGDQIEHIKVTPQFLSFEDMTKLWSALQARYRPSVSYQVSAIIVDGRT
jgi:Pvc16 N-terminal domain